MRQRLNDHREKRRVNILALLAARDMGTIDIAAVCQRFSRIIENLKRVIALTAEIEPKKRGHNRQGD